MRKTLSAAIAAMFVVSMLLVGCADNKTEFQKAFDSQHALTSNSAAFSQSPDNIFKITKHVLLQQGFTVDNADPKSGIIRASRILQDKKDKEISYNINVSADVSGMTDDEARVVLAASQQTVLHKATTTWWHLLWIIPIIPTGTEYQTLVVKEGNVVDPQFYSDFFNNLKVAVAKYESDLKAASAKKAQLNAEKKAKESAPQAEAGKPLADSGN